MGGNILKSGDRISELGEARDVEDIARGHRGADAEGRHGHGANVEGTAHPCTAVDIECIGARIRVDAQAPVQAHRIGTYVLRIEDHSATRIVNGSLVCTKSNRKRRFIADN